MQYTPFNEDSSKPNVVTKSPDGFMTRFLRYLKFRLVYVTCAIFVLFIMAFIFSFSSQSVAYQTSVSGLEQQVDNRFDLLAFIRGEGIEQQKIIEQTIKLRPRETLSELFTGQGMEASEVDALILELRQFIDPRNVKPGQEMTLIFSPLPGMDMPARLEAMRMTISPEKDLMIRRAENDQFQGQEVVHKLSKFVEYASATINASLYLAGKNAGVPRTVMGNMITAYSFDVDFQRDIRKGDSFELAYEVYRNPRGDVVKTGKILFANMKLSGDENPLYYLADGKGGGDFYKADGQGARKSLLRTPIDGARISSGFGMRRHPVLGYSKLHKGTDFAAPTGTPIKAAGDGVVEMAKWHGGYGRYIRIRHNGTYKTAYAHMKSFARGMRSGKSVKQGQIIGYVGTTGRSTGPHLHYEIHKNNAQVNPMKVKMPSGKRLAGRELAHFQDHVGKIDRLVVDLRDQRSIDLAAYGLQTAPAFSAASSAKMMDVTLPPRKPSAH